MLHHRLNSQSCCAAFLKLEAAKLGLSVHQTSPATDFRMTGYQVSSARACSKFNILRICQLPAPPAGVAQWDVGVVVSFGYFIPRRIIESFKHGLVNVHASLLPK
jgi:hypothetical protein